MKRFWICSIAYILLFSSLMASSDKKAEWFKEAKFGMFIHWGLYSILGGTYNGHTMPDTTYANGRSWYAEWIQTRLEIPGEEYRQLASQFDPVNFDADSWIKEAKDRRASCRERV